VLNLYALDSSELQIDTSDRFFVGLPDGHAGLLRFAASCARKKSTLEPSPFLARSHSRSFNDFRKLLVSLTLLTKVACIWKFVEVELG
jgi:hypothetical protein